MDSPEPRLLGNSPAGEGRVLWLPAIVGGSICAVLMRSGFLGVLFLVPPGFVAAIYNPKTVRVSVAIAVAVHTLIGLMFSFFVPFAPGDFALDTLYFTVMVSAFTWLVKAPEGGPGFLRVRAAYRLIAGAVLGTSLFLVIAASAGENSAFSAFIQAQSELISSLSVASSGSDAVRRSFLEQYLTPERIRDLMTAMTLRGGGLVSCMLVFYISRYLALFLAGLKRRGRAGTGLREFHVPPWLVWALSLSLGAILLARLLKWPVLEIAAWNVLAVCCLMYLAQGGGIVRHFLTRRLVSPGLRLLLNVAIILVVLSPGINVALLGGLILLGIAEHWAPLRALKQEGPPSTPAA